MATIERMDTTSVEDIEQLAPQLTQQSTPQKQCRFFLCQTYTPKDIHFCNKHFGKKRCNWKLCKDIANDGSKYCKIHSVHNTGCKECINAVTTEGAIYCNECLTYGIDVIW
jgi:hypothetical protein